MSEAPGLDAYLQGHHIHHTGEPNDATDEHSEIPEHVREKMKKHRRLAEPGEGSFYEETDPKIKPKR